MRSDKPTDIICEKKKIAKRGSKFPHLATKNMQAVLLLLYYIICYLSVIKVLSKQLTDVNYIFKCGIFIFLP